MDLSLNIERLLTGLESDRVERTIGTDKTSKFAKAICAFANDYPNHRQPGYLVIGANDDGSIAGLEVTEQLLQSLAAIRSDGHVLPPPAMSIHRVSLPGGDLAVVEVQPSLAPPVRYRGRVWIRIGARRAVANEQEEHILSERRSFNSASFDATPVQGAVLSNLSMRHFEDYRALTVDPEIIAANHRTVEECLASLRCYDLVNHLPTVAGILLFGNNPRHFLPCAYVQFLKFPGTAASDTPEDQLEIDGDLRFVVETLRGKILAYNKIPLIQGEQLRERSIPDYPEWAVRELLHNALMHRDYRAQAPVRFYWYADRIEIQSPGGLYGNVTPTTMTRRSAYRNPTIAEAMKAMDYVNRYGYGIQRALALLEANGNPKPEYEIDEAEVRVTLRPRPR